VPCWLGKVHSPHRDLRESWLPMTDVTHCGGLKHSCKSLHTPSVEDETLSLALSPSPQISEGLGLLSH
jgi:hypothetical protein